jgi:redox-sensitive bicupin YhaK (pirin superfamily)
LLNSNKISEKSRNLIVAEKNRSITLSFRNIKNAELISPKYLTVYHILNADVIIIEPKALETTTAWLLPVVSHKQEAISQAKGDELKTSSLKLTPKATKGAK